MSTFECPLNATNVPYVEWSPDDGTWTAPIVISLVFLPIHFALWCCASEKLGQDLLEQCKNSVLKDTVCKAYEVNSVTTALVMTTIAGMFVEGHELDPQYFCLHPDFRMHLRQTYIVICMYCIFLCILCVMLCALNYFYLSAMTDKDVYNYLMYDPRGKSTVGEALIFLMESYFLFAVAICIWVGTSYGAIHWILTILMMMFTTLVILRNWMSLSHYQPYKAEVGETESRAPSEDATVDKQRRGTKTSLPDAPATPVTTLQWQQGVKNDKYGSPSRNSVYSVRNGSPNGLKDSLHHQDSGSSAEAIASNRSVNFQDEAQVWDGSSTAPPRLSASHESRGGGCAPRSDAAQAPIRPMDEMESDLEICAACRSIVNDSGPFCCQCGQKRGEMPPVMYIEAQKVVQTLKGGRGSGSYVQPPHGTPRVMPAMGIPQMAMHVPQTVAMNPYNHMVHMMPTPQGSGYYVDQHPVVHQPPDHPVANPASRRGKSRPKRQAARGTQDSPEMATATAASPTGSQQDACQGPCQVALEVGTRRL
ncbi:unnamed protein product [Symbiodinium natans]|uniref:Uncharacterized protein n=1 Tax=Symbiodinium natans TaxID=878477 RepID=A0A812TE51_9DINO|nr:unnamed protein product [Symbiodinium natans]